MSVELITSLAVILATLAPVSGNGKLQSPFQIVQPVKAGATADRTSSCKDPPPPILSLETISRYDQNDPTRSIVVQERSDAYEAIVRPLRDYQKKVVSDANKFTRSGGENVAAGLCALQWLDAWAKADALNDMRTEGAYFSRAGSLSALSLAYIQVSNLKAAGTDRRPRIQRWLEKMGESTSAYYDQLPKSRSVAMNNHSYWAGAGAAAAGVASNNSDLVQWGYKSYRAGVCQVSKDGSLPLELRRGGRAASYHNFATAPLVLIAQIGARNGVDLDAVCDGALGRLVGFTLGVQDNPAIITQMTGYAQEGKEEESDGLGWTEIYFSRFAPPAAWAERLDRYRPHKSTLLGGNVTMLYDRDWKADDES